jgi:YgiT-type zinc finger domain-containing protein
MTCLICRQAEIVDGFTFVAFERGEFKLIVKGVPARVCPSCGEAYVEEATAARLLTIARQRDEAGSVDTQSEYSPL